MSDYNEYDSLMDDQSHMTPTTMKLIVGGSLAVAAALLIAVAQRKKSSTEKVSDGTADSVHPSTETKQGRPTATLAKRLKRHGYKKSGENITWTGEYAGSVQTVTIRRGSECTQEPSKAMARKLNAKYDKIVGEQQ